MLIDSHCHLNYKGLIEDQAGVLARARAAGRSCERPRALLVREGGAAAVEALLLNMVVVERGMAFSIFFFSWKRMAVDN